MRIVRARAAHRLLEAGRRQLGNDVCGEDEQEKVRTPERDRGHRAEHEPDQPVRAHARQPDERFVERGEAVGDDPVLDPPVEPDHRRAVTVTVAGASGNGRSVRTTVWGGPGLGLS